MKTTTPTMAPGSPINACSETGLVEGARFAESANADERPDNSDISAIIVHAISLPPDTFDTGAIEAFFCNRLDCSAHPYFTTIADLRVSAHFLIQRDGALVQFVPIHKRAWHAGQSELSGRTRVNDFSIGVELEGSDFSPFEDIQYTVLADLARVLMRACPLIVREQIVGHSDIAPGRKTDPGPFFEWDRLDRLLYQGDCET